MAKFGGVRDESIRWRSVPAEDLDLSGRAVAVVGGTGGIGRALARGLAQQGAAVVVAGRTFRDAGVAGLEFLEADLSRMSEARRLGRELVAERFDVVVFTTGIMPRPERHETLDGIEEDLAVSYLSRLVLLREIAPRLGAEREDGATRPRVFVMGFPGTGELGQVEDLNAEKEYQAMAAHMNTVAGNEALVLDAAARYPNINVYGLNPGLIRTEIRANFLGGSGSFRHRLVESLIGLLTPSAKSYARRIVPLLFTPDIDGISGVHFDRKGRAILPSGGMTPEYVDRFITSSETLLSRSGTGVG